MAPGRDVPWAAVGTVARTELRTRWRSLLVVTLLAEPRCRHNFWNAKELLFW